MRMTRSTAGRFPSTASGHTAAIRFYRRLGYTDAEPYDMSPMSMVNLQRPITPA